jgi:hypothetical protein
MQPMQAPLTIIQHGAEQPSLRVATASEIFYLIPDKFDLIWWPHEKLAGKALVPFPNYRY